MAGNLSNRIPLEGKTGFFHDLSQTINELIETIDNIIKDTGSIFSAMTQGDLSQKVTRQYQGVFNTLKKDANLTIDKLTNIIEGDIQSIVNSARNGDVSQRITINGKEGFLSLSENINNLVEVNEQVINDTSQVGSRHGRR